MKTVFLFDLDGTLCESRKPVTSELVDLLKHASNFVDIGILTGSDIDFLQEQCKDLFKNITYKNNLYALACNGTKSFSVLYKNEKLEYELIKEENLRNKLGEDKFKIVMRELIYEQTESMIDYDFPLTGNFITYRGSIINWCPVGRCANDNDRNIFKKEDANKNIRSIHIENIKKAFNENNINELIITIAGDTSFDIYPKSWDKTYAMQFFKNYDVYFWGDRMQEGGNDFTMHKLLGKNSFPVKDSNETLISVKNQLELIKQRKKNG